MSNNECDIKASMMHSINQNQTVSYVNHNLWSSTLNKDGIH